MPAFLVPTDAGQCLIPLEKAILLIGRQSDCDVALTQSRKISRKHCCIAQVNNKFVVRDLGSTNGVFVNGNRIAKEADLTIGDELVIGDVHFRMQNEAQLQSKNREVRTPATNSLKTVDESTDIAPQAQVLPNRIRPSFSAPPSLNIPVALQEDEFTNEGVVPRRDIRRSKRIDDVIPLNEEEIEEADAMPLASDSF